MCGPGGGPSEDDGFAVGDGVGVHGLSGRGVVGAVDEEVGLAGEDGEVGGVEGEGDGFGVDMGIRFGEGFGGGMDFEATDVGLGVEDLPMEVGEVDEGGVDKDESADSGSGEPGGGGAPEAAEPGDEDRGIGETGLSLGADLGEPGLAVVAVGVHVYGFELILQGVGGLAGWWRTFFSPTGSRHRAGGGVSGVDELE